MHDIIMHKPQGRSDHDKLGIFGISQRIYVHPSFGLQLMLTGKALLIAMKEIE